MRAAQLYIKETGKYIQLSVGTDFPFTLTKSIAEIQDVSKRNKTHSKTFKIPATEDNVKALGYAHVIGTDLDAINVYKQQCFIIVNGNVIEDGYVYILKAFREKDAIQFECQFVGGNEAWVVALQSLKMSDVTYNTSGSLVTVDYNDTGVKARYNTDPTTLADPSHIFITPYIYQFSDGTSDDHNSSTTYTGNSRNAKGTDFWPAFRLDYLIDAIFGTATNPLVQFTQGFDSFELDSDFFTDNATHGFWNNIYYSDRSLDEYTITFPAAGEKWGDFLPTEVSMLDFFMNVCKTFNLVFSFDGITLKVEPRNDWKSWNGTTYTGFYSGDIDWSDKVSVNQEIQYKTSNYKRQIRLSYGTDTYPIDDTLYPFVNDVNVSQPEVRYIIDTENNNEEGITDITLPFNTSLSKFYQAKFDYKRKAGSEANNISIYEGDILNNADAIRFDPDPKFSNRLFVFKVGFAPVGIRYYNSDTSGSSANKFNVYLYRPQWREWVYESTDGTTANNSDYPYIYNCMTINPFSNEEAQLLEPGGVGLDDCIISFPFESNGSITSGDGFNWDDIANVDVTDVTIDRASISGERAITSYVSNDIDDINLGIYKSNTVDMPDGLYERFWQSTIEQLITSRTLVAQVLLTRNEFVNLDVSKYYTLMGQRFILNKVKDYDPMLDEQMVEVELLAVDSFRSSDETAPACATIEAITDAGTQTTLITNDNDQNINGRGIELQRGRYVYVTAQASNADNQDLNARGVTQTGTSLAISASQTLVFNANADFDPYARGQAFGLVRLSDTQCVMIAPQVGTGNVFKVCTYDGGTNNVSVDFTVNDGDTSNYIDRLPNFAVINSPSQNVYTIASVGLTRSGAFPYARVWDLNVDDETITSRGILYPMGTSGSGNGMTQLVNLGTVGGKHCFAIFYAKATSASGVLYYAVYEYNASTNTLVEAVGDTLYKSGSNHLNGDVPWGIEDGKAPLMYLDRINYDTELTTCIWNGTTLTIGTPATFGNSSRRGLEHALRKYYNDCEDSKTQYIMATGFWNSGTSHTGDIEVFPVTYNPTANTWDVSNYNSANSDILLQDTTNPSSGHPTRQVFIGQVDKDNGVAIATLRTQGSGTAFRGAVMNNFEITNS